LPEVKICWISMWRLNVPEYNKKRIIPRGIDV
jgi:hypothetical protein